LIEGRWVVRGRAGRLLLRQWTFLVAWGGASRPASTRFDPAIYRIRSPSGKSGVDCAPSMPRDGPWSPSGTHLRGANGRTAAFLPDPRSGRRGSHRLAGGQGSRRTQPAGRRGG